MSISANGKVLVAATKDLSRRWAAAKDCWQDAKSEEFERKYFDELLSSVDKAAEVFEQLERVVVKVRNDCE